MSPPDDEFIRATIDGCQLAHRRLRVTLGGLDDEIARRPSRLPGWSVGHVVTHIARNADGHANILEGALAGEHRQQYPGGTDRRDADIEAGAGRGTQALVDDVVDTFVRLEGWWDSMTPEAWNGHGLAGDNEERPCRLLPFYRWREVEVHHVDLGMGYEPSDWPPEYLAIELPVALKRLPDRLPGNAERAALLAWLLGRAGAPSTPALSAWHERPSDYRF